MSRRATTPVGWLIAILYLAALVGLGLVVWHLLHGGAW